MSNLSSSAFLSRLAILKRFRVSYWLWTLIFSGVAIAAVAWHWSLGTPYANGIPVRQSLPILLIASFLVNGISFYFQNRYVRHLLKQPNLAQTFQVGRFALRFYLINLAVAIALSVLGFYPLLLLLFFYWIYPAILWLIPYHLIMGAILGREIRQALKEQG
ncbi:MAG: hypothetical protein D6742_00020 [Cyanobacteria bacterium J069]|nr:MAG: hypothetical protein D6742_00020 [Cyanobacteria bacterium J069]